jgi:hypothetical protein
MAFWRHSALKLTIVAMSTMSQIDCDPLAEPAMRLESCIQRAVNKMTRVGEFTHAECNLRVEGRYTVILHPAEEFSNDDLVFGGVPAALVPELRTLRTRRGPAMYVIPSDQTIKGVGARRTVLSSRTTTQSTFVEISSLMVLTKSSQPLIVEVGKGRNTNIIRRLR